MPPDPAPLLAVVLSGGVALGAFEAGVLEEFGQPPDWIAAASAGSVNAALFAGNPPDRRAARLRRFWDLVSGDPTPLLTALLGAPPRTGAWRQAYNEAAAAQSLLFGRPGLFRPRLAPGRQIGKAPALYDLAPLLRLLEELVDFDLLNRGAIRLSLTATDVETGARVVFDTAEGDRITAAHVAASCALLPIFAPVEVDGRLLADGGLASNAPLDLVLDAPGGRAVQCVVADLFPPSGQVPRSLGAAIGRAGDIAFGNQTARMIDGRVLQRRMRGLVDRLAAALPPEQRADPAVASILAEAADACPDATIVRIGYAGGLDEAGPGKLFDFSPASTSDRLQAGRAGMRRARRALADPAAARLLAPGLRLREVAAGPDIDLPDAAGASGILCTRRQG